jgi:hypothetical protein
MDSQPLELLDDLCRCQSSEIGCFLESIPHRIEALTLPPPLTLRPPVRRLLEQVFSAKKRTSIAVQVGPHCFEELEDTSPLPPTDYDDLLPDDADDAHTPSLTGPLLAPPLRPGAAATPTTLSAQRWSVAAAPAAPSPPGTPRPTAAADAAARHTRPLLHPPLRRRSFGDTAIAEPACPAPRRPPDGAAARRCAPAAPAASPELPPPYILHQTVVAVPDGDPPAPRPAPPLPAAGDGGGAGEVWDEERMRRLLAARDGRPAGADDGGFLTGHIALPFF